MSLNIEIERDEKSGGVVVTDDSTLREYKNRKKILREKTNKIDSLEKRIDNIEAALQKHGIALEINN